jgi:TonB family protein
MGYQALLFCPDDKLARVVSQVFTELDFAVELVHEPFGAVKKLMTQRFDALVVDCENEQNASLLFKSARNSSSNQSSLAIAVVEGQAGVAKAYRIGANLVLTKPINVEQAKGTLRVARGLLRKNSEVANAGYASATSASQPAKPAPPPSIGTFQSPGKGAGATAAATSQPELPEFETPDQTPVPSAVPAAATPVTAEDNPPSAPAPVTQDTVVKTVDHALAERQPASADAVAKAAALVQSSSSAYASTSGSAAAPAPAKAPAAPSAEPTGPAKPSYDGTASFGTSYGTTFGASDAPSLGALGEDSGGSGAGKKILIAAVVILALAAIGYFGYEKFGKSGATRSPQPATVQQSSAQPSAPAPAPVATPVTTTATKTPERAGSTPPILAVIAAAAAPSDKSAGKSAVTRIDLGPEPTTKKSDVTPIRVKSNTVKGKAQGDESAAPLPDTLAAAPDDSSISALMSSASSAPKPSLATLKVSQGVSQGLVIKRVPPKYPPAALAAHTHGEVLIEATVNKEGNVVNPKVLSGDPVLAKAALDAVRQWRYKPYYLDGAPVEIQTQITIRFKAE